MVTSAAPELIKRVIGINEIKIIGKLILDILFKIHFQDVYQN
jgi:hypothetical protein